MANAEVLTLDDDADIRGMLSEILDRSGYRVSQACSLAQAREHLQRAHFDVFVCDMRVGDGRGIDLIREQHETLQDTRVVVLSGENQYGGAAEEMGVDFFVAKPLSLKMFLQLMERLTNSRLH